MASFLRSAIEGTDDRRPVETPDVNVGRLYLNVLERRAKLYGLDLERGLGVGPARTAELLAQMLGYDVAEAPIDVDGEELPDETPSLERGSD